MAEWDAEVEVDEALARELIRERFPALDSRSLRRIGAGWDNVVWATADGVAFRFPRPVSRSRASSARSRCCRSSRRACRWRSPTPPTPAPQARALAGRGSEAG